MAEDIKALVKRMVEEKGLGEHWPIIDQLVQLESSWNPAAHNQAGEDSVGLFQNNRAQQGLGTGYSVEQLKNPETNAEIALSKIASVINGDGSIYDALGDWVNARNIIFQGGATTTGQGGVAMTNGQAQTGNEAWQKFIETIIQGLTSDDLVERQTAAYTVSQLPVDMQRQVFGFAEEAGVPEVLEAPSPQAVAVTQNELENIAVELGGSIQEMGLGWAAEEFKNRVTALQEGRETATWAQDYASRIAPPGMTTVPFTGPESAVGQMAQKVGFTPSPAIPLPLAPAADPYQALGQAQQLVPQAPSLQYQAPEVPQVPNLAALSGFPQVQPMPTFGGGGAGMGGVGLGGGLGGGLPAPPIETAAGLPVETRRLFSGSELPISPTTAQPDFARILAQIMQMFGGGMPMVGSQLPLRAG